jgi:excisionase family DNA binding protein
MIPLSFPKELHAHIGLLTKHQVASHLQVSLRTIDRWVADGNLPPEIKVRVGGSVRFNAAAFKRWVKSGCPKVG